MTICLNLASFHHFLLFSLIFWITYMHKNTTNLPSTLKIYTLNRMTKMNLVPRIIHLLTHSNLKILLLNFILINEKMVLTAHFPSTTPFLPANNTLLSYRNVAYEVGLTQLRFDSLNSLPNKTNKRKSALPAPLLHKTHQWGERQ